MAVVEAVVVVVVEARLDVVDAGVALVLDGELMAVVEGHRVVATTVVRDDVVVVDDARRVVDVVEAGAAATSRTGSGGSGRTAMYVAKVATKAKAVTIVERRAPKSIRCPPAGRCRGTLTAR